jgi:hypothetical protein
MRVPSLRSGEITFMSNGTETINQVPPFIVCFNPGFAIAMFDHQMVSTWKTVGFL